MIVKLLTEHHLEFLILKEGCRGTSESTLVKMPNCWKSHALAHMDIMQQSLRLVMNPICGFHFKCLVLPLEHSAILLTCIKGYIIGLENQFSVFLRVAVLRMFY